MPTGTTSYADQLTAGLNKIFTDEYNQFEEDLTNVWDNSNGHTSGNPRVDEAIEAIIRRWMEATVSGSVPAPGNLQPVPPDIQQAAIPPDIQQAQLQGLQPEPYGEQRKGDPQVNDAVDEQIKKLRDRGTISDHPKDSGKDGHT